MNIFFSEGRSAVVLDAAILLEAGWDSMVHEVWLTIVPPEEVKFCQLMKMSRTHKTMS